MQIGVLDVDGRALEWRLVGHRGSFTKNDDGSRNETSAGIMISFRPAGDETNERSCGYMVEGYPPLTIADITHAARVFLVAGHL